MCRNNLRSLKRSLPNILGQCPRERIVAFDTESEDGTADLLIENGIEVKKIRRSEFSHGHTRNLSLEYSNAEIFLFLNGDAIPVSGWLKELIRGIDGYDAAFSRQIPDEDCDPLRITDLIHHPYFNRDSDASITRDSENPILFDTVSCAIRRKTLERYNFPNVPFGEDFLWAQIVVKDGGGILYAHKSIVIHSHSLYRSIRQTINRHFEEGRLKSDYRGEYGLNYFLRFLPSAFLLDTMTILGSKMPQNERLLWFIKEPICRYLQLISFYAGLNHNLIPGIIKRGLVWK